MKKEVIICVAILSLFLLLTLSACICVNCNDNCEKGVSVDGVNLKYKNSVSLSQRYEDDNLKIEGGTLSVDLKGQSKPQADLQVEYWEYEPGDATILLKKGKISWETKSNKPVSLTRITGSIPEGLNLTIESGTGETKLDAIKGNQSVLIDNGTGRTEISNSQFNQLNVNSGTGYVTLINTTINKCSIETGTGSVNLKNSVIENAEIETGTGDLVIDKSKINKQNFTTGTGKVRIQN
ncbi:MAG: DUF4097 family beta strand repeat-containing protein [Candidatus Cloacimonas sp.]